MKVGDRVRLNYEGIKQLNPHNKHAVGTITKMRDGNKMRIKWDHSKYERWIHGGYFERHYLN